MVILAALIGLTGVLIGVILRPFVEEFFARRTKTLILILKNDQGKLTAPRGSGLSLAIGNVLVDQVYYRTFVLKNRTGRTLREFSLEFEMRFEQGSLSQRVYFEFNRTEDAVVLKDELQSTPDLSVFSFRRLDLGGQSDGRVLSTHLGVIKCRALNELEVKVVDDQSRWNVKATALMLLLVLIASVVTLLVGPLITKAYYG